MLHGLIVLASVMPNPAEVSNDHFEAIMVFLGILATALCTLAGIIIPLLLRTRRDAGEAKEQVKNNHGTNLREEADVRHEENAAQLRLIVTTMGGLTESVGALQRGQSELYKLVKKTDERVDYLEDTVDQPPPLTLTATPIPDPKE